MFMSKSYPMLSHLTDHQTCKYTVKLPIWEQIALTDFNIVFRIPPDHGIMQYPCNCSSVDPKR